MHELIWLNKAHPVSCFSVVKKVAQYMADVLEDSRDKVQENLLANGGNHHQSSLPPTAGLYQDCSKTHDRSLCNRSIIMEIVNPDDFICFVLFYSWPGHLYHQISVGHGQISNQTVTEKHLWDYLQGTQCICSLLLIRCHYSAFLYISLILIRHYHWQESSRNKQRSHVEIFPVWILASDSDRQWPEGQSFSLQQPEGKPAEPGEEECVSSSNNNMNILCVNYGLLQCL